MIEWNRKGLNEVNKSLVFALNKTGIDILTNITNSSVVPYKLGTLEQSGDVDKIKDIKDDVKIIWDTPYAAKLYFNPEYNFQNGRKGRWADDWISGYKTGWALKTFKHNAQRELR